MPCTIDENLREAIHTGEYTPDELIAALGDLKAAAQCAKARGYKTLSIGLEKRYGITPCLTPGGASLQNAPVGEEIVLRGGHRVVGESDGDTGQTAL